VTRAACDAPARVLVQPRDDVARTAERYIESFENAGRRHRLKALHATPTLSSADSETPPQMQLGHLASMCDDTGLLQHAIHAWRTLAWVLPRRQCSRAARGMRSQRAGEQRLSEALTGRFAAFVSACMDSDADGFAIS